MLHRTELVNFADLADEDEYSLSDDGKTEEFVSQKKLPSETNFLSPKTIYPCSIEQQLSSIDSTVSTRSEKSILFPLDENDYKIDQIIKSLQLRQPIQVNDTKCSIIDIAHPAQYELNSSDYLKKSPYYLTWTTINSASSTEFPSIVQNNIKTDYLSISKDLKFVHFVAPTAERMKNLSQIRKEIPIGRVIFHYVGFGLPSNQDGKISVSEGRRLKPYSVGRIFEDVRTPSWFIFDCDNAGPFIDEIMERCQKLQSRTEKHSSMNWCDWYCLCATSVNESLPKDPKLPRDFLTSCLMTPVKLSILCHILKFFRLTIDNPFVYLSKIDRSNDLHEMLTVITDAIASDFVKPKFFFQIFRRDKLVATLFRRFILAQYLLKEFDVHPVSNPSLPDMTKHQMWQEWEASIDIWITSNLTVQPSFCTSYFQRVSNFFTAAVNSEAPVSQSILSTICHIVLFQPEYFTQIADFVVKSYENRVQLSACILFDKFFQLFYENNEIGADAYESLCYIILSMIQYDYNFINDIKKDLNFMPLVRGIFERSISQVTRTLITAVLSSIANVMKSIQDDCITKTFMIQLKNEIPRANSTFLPWLLILFKRAFGLTSADFGLFYNEGVHMQIASCIFHNSFECRAATLAALSCFVQNVESNINLNYFLLMMNFTALFDISYLVRYQSLLFIIRFLTTNEKELTNLSKDYNRSIFNSFNSFSDIFDHWIGGDSFYSVYENFSLFAKAIYQSSKKENLIKEACMFSLFMIKYFCHDPHQTIKRISLSAFESFDNIINNNNSNDKPQKCHSISPPFGWHIEGKNDGFNFNINIKSDSESNNATLKPISSAIAPPRTKSPAFIPMKMSQNQLISINKYPNSQEHAPLFESDSDALLSILSRQLVLSGKDILHNKKSKSKSATLERKISGSLQAAGIEIPSAHLRLRNEIHLPIKNPVKITHEKDTTRIVLAAKSKWIYHINQTLSISSKVKISEFPISDLKMLNNKTAVAACYDGTVKLWNCGSRECYSSFRADCVITDVQNPLLFDINSVSNKIITGRNGVQYFDFNNQKLISDWKTSSLVTSLTILPSDENMCIVGLSNGNINAFDLRMKEKINIDFGKIVSVGVTEPIIKIMPNKNGADFIYGATSSGKIFEWNATTNAMKIANANIGNSPLVEFEVHKILPLIALQSFDQSPVICSPSGKVLFKAKDVPPGSVFDFHPILPIITFGTPNCDILSYDVLLSNDQK